MGGSDLGYVDLPYLFLDKIGTTTEVFGSINKSMLIHEAVLGDDDFGFVTIDVKGTAAISTERIFHILLQQSKPFLRLQGSTC
jgi:hypothetical protein